MPKFYLKNFCIDNNFYILLADENKIIDKAVPYKNQCYEDYFYGEDEVWENKLACYERQWSLSVRKIIMGDKLTEEDYDNIRKFVFYQKERTYGSNIHKTNQINESRLECLKMAVNMGKVNEKTLKYIIDNNKIFKPSEHIEILEKVIFYVDDLKILIIKYDTTLKLISSDMPVITINPFYPDALGVGSMGLVVFLPISPNKLLVLYDSKMYKNYNEFDYIESKSEYEVEVLNKFQFISAEKIVFSESSLNLNKFDDNCLRLRKNNRSKWGIVSFGPEDRKLIGLMPRVISFPYELSFAQLPSKIKSIPLNCRENLLRKVDKKCIEKLENKMKILPLMIRQGIINQNDISCSSKEAKKGCKEMLRFAKKYWKI